MCHWRKEKGSKLITGNRTISLLDVRFCGQHFNFYKLFWSFTNLNISVTKMETKIFVLTSSGSRFGTGIDNCRKMKSSIYFEYITKENLFTEDKLIETVHQNQTSIRMKVLKMSNYMYIKSFHLKV